jgi:hypothetical protein
MQEILVDRSEFVLEDLVEVRDDFDVALHGVGSGSRLEGAAGAALGSGSLRGGSGGIKFFAVEHPAGTRLAGTAAGRHAGAGLQLLERAGAFVDRLLQAGFRDAVAETDVHGVSLFVGSILCQG